MCLTQHLICAQIALATTLASQLKAKDSHGADETLAFVGSLEADDLHQVLSVKARTPPRAAISPSCSPGPPELGLSCNPSPKVPSRPPQNAALPRRVPPPPQVEGYTCLQRAVQCDDSRSALVQLLFFARRSLSPAILTQLLSAALRHRATACAEELLRAGAHPNTADHGSGVAPLEMAASSGHAPSVRLLLAHGASPAALGRLKLGALRLAVRAGSVECVRALLKAGADVSSCAVRDFPPLLFYTVARVFLCSVRK